MTVWSSPWERCKTCRSLCSTGVRGVGLRGTFQVDIVPTRVLLYMPLAGGLRKAQKAEMLASSVCGHNQQVNVMLVAELVFKMTCNKVADGKGPAR